MTKTWSMVVCSAYLGDQQLGEKDKRLLHGRIFVEGTGARNIYAVVEAVGREIVKDVEKETIWETERGPATAILRTLKGTERVMWWANVAGSENKIHAKFADAVLTIRKPSQQLAAGMNTKEIDGTIETFGKAKRPGSLKRENKTGKERANGRLAAVGASLKLKNKLLSVVKHPLRKAEVFARAETQASGGRCHRAEVESGSSTWC